MSTAFKPEVATDGVVKIPSSVFKSLPPPAAKKEGVIGVVRRLDGTVEELGAMSYVKSNPNFQPRQTEWTNNVTVINKDEALIKLHLRKGIPLPPELQVSGCFSRRPRACLSSHAPHHPIAPAELQASGCLLTPHASRRMPYASCLAWHRKSHAARLTPHAARRTPHRKSRASRLTPRPTTGQAKKERLEAAAAESKSGVFSRLGGGKATRPGKSSGTVKPGGPFERLAGRDSGTIKPGGTFSRLAGKAIGEAIGDDAPAAAAPEVGLGLGLALGLGLRLGLGLGVRGRGRVEAPAAAASPEAR
jgi:hypothetical protein